MKTIGPESVFRPRKWVYGPPHPDGRGGFSRARRFLCDCGFESVHVIHDQDPYLWAECEKCGGKARRIEKPVPSRFGRVYGGLKGLKPGIDVPGPNHLFGGDRVDSRREFNRRLTTLAPDSAQTDGLATEFLVREKGYSEADMLALDGASIHVRDAALAAGFDAAKEAGPRRLVPLDIDELNEAEERATRESDIAGG